MSCMRIISFAWTTPALLAGRKTVTRREWDDSYASRFGEGEPVAVYDRSPRYGGKQVATIQLTRVPYRESTRDAPDSDYEAEGFAYLDSIGAKVDGLAPWTLWQTWKLEPRTLWVVRFKLLGRSSAA